MTPYLFAFSVWTTLRRLGGPGLILLGILDSSFVPIPGSMDLLVVILTAANTGWWWYYALMATAGSLIGGFLTYRAGRKGGKAALEKRFPKKKLEKVYNKFEKGGGGIWTLFVPAMLPPPFPLTPFLVAAGALDYPQKKFFISLGAGRLVRYGALSLLAHFYGRWIIGFMEKYRQPLMWSFIALFALGILAAVGGYFYHRWKQADKQPSSKNARLKPRKAA
ncbi:MAG TPA: VTT domain-containing protein [Terriglobales bacterium]|nr:VTT domain-containing protein [Terriglobales bacterium]